MSASRRTGTRATPYEGGVTFRTWAPFARRVSVAGTFNGWSTTATPLSQEGNGFWSADVADAAVGAEYKFIVISQATGSLLWKNDPCGLEMTQSNGNSIVAAPDFPWDSGTYRTPSWDEMVIYEVHVGSFLFDATCPAAMCGGAGGTFESLISKLDYLVELGVNVIEIMASGEFASDHSWGYNQSYMFAIEHLYGGQNGFRRLVDEAHSRGVAIVFDVVYNHIGPQDCDMWQFDGWSQDNHGGIYFYNDWRRTTPWGENRPDYGRSEVRQYLCDNAMHWLEACYCDGLRWDATGWIRNVFGNNNEAANDLADGWSLMQWVNSEIRVRQPWKISIAEDMQQNEWLTRPASRGGAGFNAQWDAGFVHPIRAAIIGADDSARNMEAVRRAIEFRYNDDALARVIYTESHDEDANGHQRVPEEIWPGRADSYYSQKRSTLGAAVVLTAPGIPMIFQGQEFLQYGYFDDGKELDWTLADRHRGIVNLYRDLIRLRRNWFNNTRGLRGEGLHVHHVNNSDKVVAFHRWDGGGTGDDVIVVLNFANTSYSSYTLGFPRQGLWRVRLNTDWSGYSSDFANTFSYDTVASPQARDEMGYTANVGIGPYTAIVLSQ